MKVDEGPVAGLYSIHGAPGPRIPEWPSTTGKPVKVVKVVKVKEKAVKVNTQLHKSSGWMEGSHLVDGWKDHSLLGWIEGSLGRMEGSLGWMEGSLGWM